MKIAIDCRELRGQAGGFRTYLLGLLEGLAQINADNEYILYVHQPIDISQLVLPRHFTLSPIISDRIAADWIFLRKQIYADQPDIVHFPSNYGLTGLQVPMVITLHDCISLDPQQRCASIKSELLRRYSAFMTQRSIQHASVIITVSDYSRKQIICRFGGTNCIVVTHEAVRVPPKQTLANTGCISPNTQPYLLVLASTDPRKNTEVVMKAFSKSCLSREKCKLIIVASHPSARSMVEHQAAEIGIQSLIETRTGVDDSVLQQLYRGCIAFVFPSLDEGFGFPPLEAMACGTAVLSSSRASMPEVLGDAALYFDPTDPHDLANKMDEIVGQEALRARLRKAGAERIALFSWQETALGTLKAYERAARTCA